MVNFPKITIVTPNYNGDRFLEETILSVIGQDYPNLEYFVIDGCSTDKSIDIIKKHEKKITWWVSEPDNGMYGAIQKGFDRSTGEIMGWINSDDILQKKSLFAIADIFSNNKEVHWVQGYPNVIDELGRVVYHRQPCYSKFSFYIKGYHDGIFVQQESTFWRRELWIDSGASLSKKTRYAGDFELWIRFFGFADLYNTKTILGSFRSHSTGQISNESFSKYLLECDEIISEVKKTLGASDKHRLFHIRILRKIKMYVPRLYKLLHLNKLEIYLLSKPFNVEFDFATKHYKSC